MFNMINIFKENKLNINKQMVVLQQQIYAICSRTHPLNRNGLVAFVIFEQGTVPLGMPFTI